MQVEPFPDDAVGEGLFRYVAWQNAIVTPEDHALIAETAGRMARLSFGLANVANRSRPLRVLMEKTVGVHRDKLLPEFAAEAFDDWAEKMRASRPHTDAPRPARGRVSG